MRSKYLPILDIPDGVSGEYRVRGLYFDPHHKFTTAGARNALLGGQKNETVSFNHSVRFHELSGPTGVWMTDLPVEQAQANRVFTYYRGQVLVGGLGLGYAVTRIALRKQVTRVVVVEVSQDVINLVVPHFGRWLGSIRSKITVVTGDLFQYLGSTTDRFDRAFYDIWQSDGETTFFNVVCPLLRRSVEVVKRRPDCWNEDVMQGQLYFSLLSDVHGIVAGWDGFDLRDRMIHKNDIWWDWKCAFFHWYQEVQPTLELAKDAIVLYVQQYGVPQLRDSWPPPTFSSSV